MKLNLEEILNQATVLYRIKKHDAGLDGATAAKLEIRSDQVKALAEALVEAINANTQ